MVRSIHPPRDDQPWTRAGGMFAAEIDLAGPGMEEGEENIRRDDRPCEGIIPARVLADNTPATKGRIGGRRVDVADERRDRAVGQGSRMDKRWGLRAGRGSRVTNVEAGGRAGELDG